MGRRYVIGGTQNVASPSDTLLTLISAATVRPEIYEVDVFSTATPANNAIKLLMQRFTAVGTGTSVTPRALDPADPSALASADENHTAEPTYTAGEVLSGDGWGFNQQYPFRWVALDAKATLKLPATANNGVGLIPEHSSFTGLVGGTIYFEE